MARVEQARAIAMQARSQFVPNVTYSGTVSRGETICLGLGSPNNGNTVSSTLAALNASWELDLWDVSAV